MSHMYTPYCTLCAQDGIRTDLASYEGHRSKAWRYCDECYIRRFPKAAKKKGLIHKAPVVVIEPVKQEIPAQPVQLTLFEIINPMVIGCGCLGDLPEASDFNHNSRKGRK